MSFIEKRTSRRATHRGWLNRDVGVGKALTSHGNGAFRRGRRRSREEGDGYYVAYKSITHSCMLFMFIEMIFLHCPSYMMFAMKSMSMCNG